MAAEPALEPIFNGRDLTGWSSPDKEKFWRVEDGVLIGESVADVQVTPRHLALVGEPVHAIILAHPHLASPRDRGDSRRENEVGGGRGREHAC